MKIINLAELLYKRTKQIYQLIHTPDIIGNSE